MTETVYEWYQRKERERRDRTTRGRIERAFRRGVFRGLSARDMGMWMDASGVIAGLTSLHKEQPSGGK